jgi:hypothetical protein
MMSNMPYYVPNKILTILFIIFILINPEIPYNMSKHIRSDYGLFILFTMTLSLFFTNDYILIIFGCIVSYLIFMKSGEYHQTKKYASSEAEKLIRYDMYNSDPVTLEQEVISSLVPRTKKVSSPQKYKPYMDNVHSAGSV